MKGCSQKPTLLLSFFSLVSFVHDIPIIPKIRTVREILQYSWNFPVLQNNISFHQPFILYSIASVCHLPSPLFHCYYHPHASPNYYSQNLPVLSNNRSFQPVTFLFKLFPHSLFFPCTDLPSSLSIMPPLSFTFFVKYKLRKLHSTFGILFCLILVYFAQCWFTVLLNFDLCCSMLVYFFCSLLVYYVTKWWSKILLNVSVLFCSIMDCFFV